MKLEKFSRTSVPQRRTSAIECIHSNGRRLMTSFSMIRGLVVTQSPSAHERARKTSICSA